MKKISTLLVATMLYGAIGVIPAFADGHAKDALKEYQQTAEKNNAAQAEKLQTEISSLQTEITEDKTASMAADIEKRISIWIHKIENLKV